MSHLLEPLDPKFILDSIAPRNRHYLRKLEIFDTIDSTNTYLLQKAKEDISSGFLCLTDQQTQGRGRFGKSWVSPPGANIYCSLFWRFAHLQHEISGLSMAVAVMIAKVLHQYGIKQGVQLKWPNDVLFLGKKLGGILLETNAPQTIVIGIGLNLYLPDNFMQPELAQAISISNIIKSAPERNRLIGLLVNEMFEQLPVYEKKGLEAFIDDWRKLDVLMGKKITVYTQGENIVGQMLGVNESGELLMQDEAGLQQQFRCGEVSVREG